MKGGGLSGSFPVSRKTAISRLTEKRERSFAEENPDLGEVLSGEPFFYEDRDWIAGESGLISG